MLYILIAVTPFYITLFWSIVFLSKGPVKKPPFFTLGVFMVLSAGLYLSHALYFLGFYNAYLSVDAFYMFASLSVYPMYFWYVKMLTSETDFNYINLLHFIPAIALSVVMLALHLVASFDERMSYFRRVLIDNDLTVVVEKGNAGALARIFLISRIYFAFQVFYYLIRGYRLADRYNDRIAAFYSNMQQRQLLWVKLLSLIFLFTSVSSLIFNIIGRGIFLENKEMLLFPSLLFSALLFMIGYQGNLQVFTIKDVVCDESNVHHYAVPVDAREILKKRLIELMEKEQLFLLPDLRISLLCERLHTNRTYISGLINDEFGESFNAFVNRYRVKYVCAIMQQRRVESNYSLDYLATEAGFGSASSFIRSFKQLKGVTPGKYMKNSGL